MAFWQFTGSVAEYFPTVGLTAKPGKVYDFRNDSPPLSSVALDRTGTAPNTAAFRWTPTAGPATDGRIGDTTVSDATYIGSAGGGGGLDAATAAATYVTLQQKPDTAKTAAFTVSTSKPNVVDISGGSFSANLPAANAVPAGKEAYIKVGVATDPLSPTTALSVTPAGSDTINGSATALTMRVKNRTKRLVSDGVSNWLVLGGDTDATVEKQINDGLYAPFSAVRAVIETGGTYPSRPASTGPVFFIGPDAPTGGGSVTGGAGAVDGLDVWIRT